MRPSPNTLRWDGAPGHYEVYYLTLTERRTGVGVWIRYTLLAPQPGQEPPSASLWFLAMDPRPGKTATIGRKKTIPIDALKADANPFRLQVGDAVLGDRGMSGAFDDVAWNLSWASSEESYQHVHPILERAGIAKTVLELPHADLRVDGAIEFAGERLELNGTHGGQAHLWGSKHASSWAWVHCNDFATLDGTGVDGDFVDGVSVLVPKMGREIGPNTPLVARIDGRDFRSVSPLRVVRNGSTFALTGWRFEAIAGPRRLIGEVDADRDQLAGVTYHDPDGELAYCYNSETATMRLHVYERARQVGGWAHRKTLVADRRAHFEYAQRTPVPDLELLTR